MDQRIMDGHVTTQDITPLSQLNLQSRRLVDVLCELAKHPPALTVAETVYLSYASGSWTASGMWPGAHGPITSLVVNRACFWT